MQASCRLRAGIRAGNPGRGSRFRPGRMFAANSNSLPSGNGPASSATRSALALKRRPRQVLDPGGVAIGALARNPAQAEGCPGDAPPLDASPGCSALTRAGIAAARSSLPELRRRPNSGRQWRKFHQSRTNKCRVRSPQADPRAKPGRCWSKFHHARSKKLRMSSKNLRYCANMVR